MSVKVVVASALVLAVAVAPVWSQGPYPTLPVPRVQEPTTSAAPRPGEAPVPESYPLSSWLTYEGKSCTGETSGRPLLSELYLRSGVSYPTGGKVMGEVLGTG